MFTETFEEIGLSPNEAKIYETLLSTKEIGVAEISLKAKVHRRNVYDALNRLVEKGLVFRIFQKGEHQFRAVTPDKLSEVLEAKQHQLSKILPNLHKMYATEPLQEAAFIYKGLEGYKNYRRDLVRVAEDTYFLGAKAVWMDPNLDRSYVADFKNALKSKNKKLYTLYDYRVKEKMPRALKEGGGDYKILPKKYAAPGVTDVFGDYVVTFAGVDVGKFGEDGTIFVMKNKQLAETYRTWFKMIWDFCPDEKE
jgi:sugar-specific transcriptional regulator TrmB